MKICSVCLLEKPLDDYYTVKRALATGGFSLHQFPKCKECEKASQKIRRRERGILPRDQVVKFIKWVEGTDPTCANCGETKSIEYFNVNLTARGIRPVQSMCKACKMEYNKNKYMSSKVKVSGKSNIRVEFQNTIITIDGEKIRIGRKVVREIEIKLRKNGYSFLFKGYGDK